MSDETDYWKSVALWMGDVLAATAAHQIDLKSVGRGEKQRQARIASIAADALAGTYCPSARAPDVVIARLREVPPAGSL